MDFHVEGLNEEQLKQITGGDAGCDIWCADLTICIINCFELRQCPDN